VRFFRRGSEPPAGERREVPRDDAGAGSTEEAAQSPEPTTVAGERGIASVNRVRSIQARVSNVLAIGLMSVLGLGLLTWYYAQTIARQSRATEDAQAASRSKAQGEMPLPALGRVDPPVVTATPSDLPPAASDEESIAIEAVLGPAPDLPPGQSTPIYNAAGAYGLPTGYGMASEKTPAQLAFERRLAGPVLAGPSISAAGSGIPSGAVPAVESPDLSALLAQTDQAPGSGPESSAPTDSALVGLLRPNVTPAVQAQVLPTQRMLLPKGAFIDCTLETAIDSSLPGLTTCITATNTFGADGKVVLLERGTKLVGETRGEVRQGSARVFVLWTEARTPTGVVVPLASPGTDELGRPGLPGKVNRHFFERFGAAILISVIDGAIQAAVQSESSGGTVIYDPSSSQDIMTEVLKSTINIPPTVVKQNGDRIQILVARDLDFRPVYELRPVAAGGE